MRWSRSALRAAACFVLLSAALTLLLASPASEEKRLSIYSLRASYSVPVVDRDGTEYVNLFAAIEPLCSFTSAIERGTWKLRCDNTDAEFKPDRSDAKVGGKHVDLGGRFAFENGHGLVPVRALQAILAAFFNQKADLHAAGRRLFVGDAVVKFTPELRKDSLTLNFTAPVNPVISTEPGKLKMTFKREPVSSTASAYSFYDNRLVNTVTYDEINGNAEVAVTGPVPLLASFANEGKSIIFSAAPEQASGGPAAQGTPASPALPISAIPPIGENPVAGAPAVALPKYVVVIDAGHGGDERGAALGDNLSEKDVTIAIARRLRMELQARGIAPLMTRDGDATVPIDQRAAVANTTRTILFVSLHAGTVGHGVRLYTAMLPAASSVETHGPFLPWDMAQRDFLAISHSVAQQIGGELTRREVPVQILLAAIRPLNNVAAPAIAVEVSPPKDRVDVLTSAAYQENVASALATVIAVARPRLEQVH